MIMEQGMKDSIIFNVSERYNKIVLCFQMIYHFDVFIAIFHNSNAIGKVVKRTSDKWTRSGARMH